MNKIHPSSEIVNIFELGEKVVHENELMANEKGVSLFLNLEVNLNCFADPGMVKIVLHNLISNAIKFTPKGGSVIVDSKSFSNYIEISVKDDGIGIDEDEVKDIFNFEKKKLHIGTNKEKGTGLGLDVCREFVDANGGLIWAESNIGKGTVIYFTLPSRYSSSAEGQDNAYQEFSN